MKTINQFLFGGLLCMAPALLQAQFMNEYIPSGPRDVTNTINLVSVTETFASNTGHTRSVNTLGEDVLQGFTGSDAWVHSVDNFGNTTLSIKYGLRNTTETASAIVRCPNGDFIVAANTDFQGLPAIWLFRIDIMGNLLWSNRFLNNSNKLRAYCIKQTTERDEHYIIAGTANSDQTLLAFKITRNGNLVWNFAYTDPASTIKIIDIPKSMVAAGENMLIAGNRNTNQNANRDIFVIGINQANGLESIPYRYIDNDDRDDFDPFINTGINGEYVITSRVVANIAGQTTGRIAYNRLTAGLGLALLNTALYWEAGAINSYGHSIYTNANSTGYDIGGGTSLNQSNPLFFSINNAGAVTPGSYRRLWTNRFFVSTFMQQDAFNTGNRYTHHNYFSAPVDPPQGSMSLLRNTALPSPCNVFKELSQSSVPATLIIRDYKEEPFIGQTPYPVNVIQVNGSFYTCSGFGGSFRTPGETASTEAKSIDAPKNLQVYPSLLRGGAALNIDFPATAETMYTVRIYNMQSQPVLKRTGNTRTGNNHVVIDDAGALAAGVYIVELQTGLQTHQAKIVKQ